MDEPLLSVRQLTVDFATDSGNFRAVDGLSFDIPKGKTVALVGKSGSGKSVTAQAILQILPKQARIGGGAIVFSDPGVGESVDIAGLEAESSAMRAHARRTHRDDLPGADDVPFAAAHHRRPDFRKLSHAYRRRPGGSKKAHPRRSGRVGFPDPKRALRTYPFELSGGLRQRAMIAMALITKPALLIADEPTTALDVTTQAQILDLIKELQVETGMSVLLITHDLGVVANVADEVVVIYRGRVMEAGSREDLFRKAAASLPPGAHARRPTLCHGRRRTADADPRGQEHGAGANRTAGL